MSGELIPAAARMSMISVETTARLTIYDKQTITSPKETISQYNQVPDVAIAAAKVVDLGGKVLVVTNYESGANAECLDPSGAPFQLHQPSPGYERQ